MKRSFGRMMTAIGAITIGAVIVLAPPVQADCPDCGTAFVACGQTVLAAFQQCLGSARTRTAVQACLIAANQAVATCQTQYAACIGTCPPAN